MPDEKDKSDADIEAEMLRMMEQEASGGASQDTSQEASSDNPEDEMLKMMQDAMSETQGGGEAAPVDDKVLEMEMLKAMQGEGGGGSPAAVSSFQSFSPPVGVEGTSAALSRILDVNVKITVELGANHTPIRDILTWDSGTLVELERLDREPVDVLVNDRLFARGEIVVVGETFGVRITELLNGSGK